MGSDFIGRGGLWVVSQSLLLTGVLLGGFIWARQWSAALSTWLGAALLILGGLLGLAGAIGLGRNLTPLPNPGDQARLVRTGVYGLMRHPIYIAVFIAALGWALLKASIPALAFAILLALFFDAKARHEEKILAARFPEYAGYARQVSRFVPRVY